MSQLLNRYARQGPPDGSLAAKMLAVSTCRLCERSRTMRKLTRHRVVPGRYGGRYVAANVVPLCRPCHDEVEAPDVTGRRMLRPLLWPEEIAHAISRMGKPWLDRYYPVPAAGITQPSSQPPTAACVDLQAAR